MRGLKKQERNAIEAVAKRFSAAWEEGSDPRDVYLVAGGKRIAVDIRTLKRRGAGQSKAVEPRLRFDKVATRLTERLKRSLGKTVPQGMTVLLTVTAPIRLPSKTAAAIEERIRGLAGGDPGGDSKDTIYGNRVQIRVFRDPSNRVPGRLAPKLIAFVHNPDVEAALFFSMTRELLELSSVGVGGRATKRAAGWLVAISTRGIAALEAYRYVYSQLGVVTSFQKVLVVFGDGRVGLLRG